MIKKLRAYLNGIDIKWGNAIIVLVSISIGVFTYSMAIENRNTLKTEDIISNLLTVNGIFSAILITYLFTRIALNQQDKSNLYNEAIEHSQKITDFRRILDKLTRYYSVWANEEATKGLMDQGRYKTMDIHDYKMNLALVKETRLSKAISELFKDKRFDEGISITYLAMVSLVRNRKESGYRYLSELYKDFQRKGVYSYFFVQRWVECNATDTIHFWLSHDPNWINYSALRKEKEYILEAAARINKKYKNYDLGNDLIKELADDIGTFHLKELNKCLFRLRNGFEGLNFLILGLSLTSLLFGVLLPFILMLINSRGCWFSIAVVATGAFSVALISFTIIKLPSLIKRELQWVQ